MSPSLLPLLTGVPSYTHPSNPIPTYTFAPKPTATIIKHITTTSSSIHHSDSDDHDPSMGGITAIGIIVGIVCLLILLFLFTGGRRKWYGNHSHTAVTAYWPSDFYIPRSSSVATLSVYGSHGLEQTRQERLTVSAHRFRDWRMPVSSSTDTLPVYHARSAEQSQQVGSAVVEEPAPAYSEAWTAPVPVETDCEFAAMHIIGRAQTPLPPRYEV